MKRFLSHPVFDFLPFCTANLFAVEKPQPYHNDTAVCMCAVLNFDSVIWAGLACGTDVKTKKREEAKIVRMIGKLTRWWWDASILQCPLSLGQPARDASSVEMLLKCIFHELIGDAAKVKCISDECWWEVTERDWKDALKSSKSSEGTPLYGGFLRKTFLPFKKHPRKLFVSETVQYGRFYVQCCQFIHLE